MAYADGRATLTAARAFARENALESQAMLAVDQQIVKTQPASVDSCPHANGVLVNQPKAPPWEIGAIVIVRPKGRGNGGQSASGIAFPAAPFGAAGS
jgi:hypothetical protein